MNIKDLKEQVLEVCRMLPECRLVTGMAGEVSARDPFSGRIIMQPEGVPYQNMRVEDILVLNPDGSVFEGDPDRSPRVEASTHLELYKCYPHINGIVHTHAKYVNILAGQMAVIPCGITSLGRKLLLRGVEVLEYVDNGTRELAENIVPAFKKGVAAAVRNHGPFTAGETLQLALDRAIILEEICEIYYKSSLLGIPSLLD